MVVSNLQFMSQDPLLRRRRRRRRRRQKWIIILARQRRLPATRLTGIIMSQRACYAKILRRSFSAGRHFRADIASTHRSIDRGPEAIPRSRANANLSQLKII